MVLTMAHAASMVQQQCLASRSCRSFHPLTVQRPMPNNQLIQRTAVQTASSCLSSTKHRSVSTLVSMQHCSTTATAAAAGASLVAARAADIAAAVTCPQDAQQAVHNDSDDLKMVLCVNQSLKMGKGKIGAQCAHAAIGAVLQLLASDASLFVRWEQCGQRKIVVKVQDAQCMEALAASAAAAGYAAYIMRDAGRTQVAPDSQTVLALGPAPQAEIDRLTGHLQLL